MVVVRGFIAVFVHIILLLTSFYYLPSVYSSPFEVDATASVYHVVDGDTFDAFPVGRVRLADVDAPERGEAGYTEATNALKSLVLNEKVYLDVDDLNVMDSYNRIVCVVYVRNNSRHDEGNPITPSVKQAKLTVTATKQTQPPWEIYAGVVIAAAIAASITSLIYGRRRKSRVVSQQPVKTLIASIQIIVKEGGFRDGC